MEYRYSFIFKIAVSDCMEQRPNREANSYSVNQEIPSLLWNVFTTAHHYLEPK
jgi:hypothetical protein